MGFDIFNAANQKALLALTQALHASPLVRQAPRDPGFGASCSQTVFPFANSGKKIKLANLFSLVQGFLRELQTFNCARCEEFGRAVFKTTTKEQQQQKMGQLLFHPTPHHTNPHHLTSAQCIFQKDHVEMLSWFLCALSAVHGRSAAK